MRRRKQVNSIGCFEVVEVGPVVCGVYALLSGDRVVYVGQSTNVLRRLYDHRERRGSAVFDVAMVMGARPEALNRVEAFLIEQLSPPLNRHGRMKLNEEQRKSFKGKHRRWLARLAAVMARRFAEEDIVKAQLEKVLSEIERGASYGG